MADWTSSEKKKLRGRLHTPLGTTVPATFEHVSNTSSDDLPDTVDWVAKGAVTPPKDQVLFLCLFFEMHTTIDTYESLPPPH
jgi:hypothetical protein